MTRNELVTLLRKDYIKSRVHSVEPEFIELEEEMVTVEDLQRILDLKGQVSNEHNSALLYISGRSNDYDFTRTVDTVGGSPPDVDVDFETLNYQRIVDWIIEKYGREHVANIIAITKFKPKSTIQKYFAATEPIEARFASKELYLKALEDHKKTQFELQTKIPKGVYGFEPTLDEVVNGNPKKGYKPQPEIKEDKRYQGWYQTASELEGMVANFSVHAAGMVISDNPITDHMPIMYRMDEKEKVMRWITQFPKDEVEELGLLKYDLLRIDNLSVIKLCMKYIEERHGVKLELYKFEDGDSKAYDLMSRGYLAGIFQMETSKAALDLCQKIRPSNINELSDLSALNVGGL